MSEGRVRALRTSLRTPARTTPLIPRRSTSQTFVDVRRQPASGSRGSDLLSRILQSQGVGRIRRPQTDGRVFPRSAIPRIVNTAKAAVTRATAAKRATAARAKGKPNVPIKDPDPIFDRRPRIPIERISEVPRPTRPGPTEPRFSAPSLGQLGGGQPIVHLPATVATPIPAPKTVAKETPPVSIHKGLIKSIGTGLSGAITQRLGGQSKAIPIVAGVATAAGRVLPAIGRVLGSRTVAAGSTGLAIGSLFGGGGGGACPSGEHLAKDGSGRCVRNRRMNFGNARAARRSVRRLKGARKLLRDIEKMMPSKTRTRRAPAGHSAHLHHTGGS